MDLRLREHGVCSLLACSLLFLAGCSSERADAPEVDPDAPRPVMRSGSIGQLDGAWTSPDWVRSDRMLTPAEQVDLDATQPAVVATPPPPTSKELALRAAAKLPPNERITVVVSLRDVPFNYEALQGMGQTAKVGARATRSAAIAPSQAAFESKATTLGAASFERFTLGNHVAMKIDAGQLPTLAALPEVVSVSLDARAEESVVGTIPSPRGATFLFEQTMGRTRRARAWTWPRHTA